MKKQIFDLGPEIFNKAITVVKECRQIGYGVYGRPVLNSEGVEIGFQANEKQYSYGWQANGVFRQYEKEIKLYRVIQENENNDEMIFQGSWRQALKIAKLSDKPCFIVSALEDIQYCIYCDIYDEEKKPPVRKFTNKAWNRKEKENV